MIDWKKRMTSTINSEVIYKRAIEGTFQVAISLAYIKKYDVYIYGAGRDIHAFIKFLKAENLKVKGIIDRSIEKQNKQIYGVPVISFAEFVENQSKKKFVFIWTCFLDDRIGRMRVEQMLNATNAVGYYEVADDRKIVVNSTSEWVDADRIRFYLENEQKIVDSIEYYADECSKETLVEYVRTYIECDRYRLPQIDTNYKYFYGDKKEILFLHRSDENWLNCGANVGDNIFTYLRFENPFNKIVAVEGDNRIANVLDESINLLDESIKSRIVIVREFINQDFDITKYLGREESISLINADIEGNELELLILLRDYIIWRRPVIALCLYHRKEDIITIPEYVTQNFKGYVLKLRKYKACRPNLNENHELVLYAIPRERNY